MATATMFRCAVLASWMLASASAAAEPSDALKRGDGKSALERANDDVRRQLRPSGLKKHVEGFGALAARGYEDVRSKLSGKPQKR